MQPLGKQQVTPELTRLPAAEDVSASSVKPQNPDVINTSSPQQVSPQGITVDRPERQNLAERNILKTDTTPSIEECLSPDNDHFVADLENRGDEIYSQLKNQIDTPPKDRTCQMPGMAKVVKRVQNFIERRILADEKVCEADKQLYRQLIQAFAELAGNNYPWNQAFPLIYKATHYISFYNKDKAPNRDQHYSYYKEGATLEKLSNLQWKEALDNPQSFIESLRELWFPFNFDFSGRIKPLSTLSSFCYPCMDELSLEHFNRTWMLRIHPLGVVCPDTEQAHLSKEGESEATEIFFDGKYGLAADFFEHDIFHAAASNNSSSSIIKPSEYLPIRLLIDEFESLPADFPKEALEVALFIVNHEQSDVGSPGTELEFAL